MPQTLATNAVATLATNVTPTVEDRSAEFVAVSGSQETSSAETLLLTAYIVMWVLVFIFVWTTARRQKALATRLDSLESSLESFDRGLTDEPTASPDQV